jgi:hypothetical protein
VRALKEQPGGEIGVTGSIGVVWGADRAGLVDEYRLFVFDDHRTWTAAVRK